MVVRVSPEDEAEIKELNEWLQKLYATEDEVKKRLRELIYKVERIS